jgi:Fe-S cluster assembly protein SufD
MNGLAKVMANKKNKQRETKAGMLFSEYFENTDFPSDDTVFLTDKRRAAAGHFAKTGFPSTGSENWRKTDLTETLNRDYDISFSSKERTLQLKSIFECQVNDFDTDLFTILNGYCINENKSLDTDSGIVVCSMTKAQHDYPELFEKYFGTAAKDEKNGLTALNTATFTDGYFIYVPDNTDYGRTIQMVNLIDAAKRIFTNTRNLVIVGRNASLKLVHCDDSLSAHGSFVNTVTEFFVEDGGKLDFYKLQNKDEEATVITNNFIKQGRDTHTRSNTITLNGGLIRNDTVVEMNGRGGESEVYGLYLVDRRQFVDNHVFVDHAVSDCISRQLFKGIADEEARAVFNGHILVRQDAQRTEAYQNNNNIQLTDTAAIDTHPFLEIYADDVKCSHGATVGQLDTDALFYMKQRGICDRTARMLLMYSFAQEVINKIELPALSESIQDLVTRRLKGELSACENCSLSCENPDSAITFDIDMSKI